MLAGNWDDGGGTIVKRSMIYTALAVLALSTPAAAQGYQPGASHGACPAEILTMLRSTGFEPIGQPVRRGPNYVLLAIDDNDREVSLVISARSGDILSVTPMQTASRMPPPPGVSMGPYERMPPGYMPPGGRGSYSLPDTDDDDDAAAASLRLRCAASARLRCPDRCRVRAMPRRLRVADRCSRTTMSLCCRPGPAPERDHGRSRPEWHAAAAAGAFPAACGAARRRSPSR